MLTPDTLSRLIEPLKEPYQTLHESLKDITDEKTLRQKLLGEMNPLVAGSPQATDIHRVLRALGRLDPMNTTCPNTLEEINFEDTDSYLVFSTGHVLSRQAEYKKALSENAALWFFPSTRVPYSAHDTHYLETTLDIKKPVGPDIIDVAFLSIGVLILTANELYLWSPQTNFTFRHQTTDASAARQLFNRYVISDAVLYALNHERTTHRQETPAPTPTNRPWYSRFGSGRTVHPEVPQPPRTPSRRRDCVIL